MVCKNYSIILWLLLSISCTNNNESYAPIDNKKQPEYFLTLTDPENTNLYFTNKVLETDDHNYLTYESMYNGSGVAIGDINNDGLPDIYLGGNSVFDKLYLNKGGLQFEDISKSSGISGVHSGWTTGINMIDINSDGLLDIYVCRGGPFEEESDRKNKLFINNGDLTFKESAADYGLDNSNYSIQTAFFDYDLDGDLDMYLMNQPPPSFQLGDVNYKELRNHIDNGKLRTDNFYENVNHEFIEKSNHAGLVNIGYRLGIAVGDINQDNYPDLYLTSDYDGADLMYINNGDKTFSNVIRDQLGHLSLSSMGAELSDINNDGLLDIFVVEMAMEDHVRSKMEMLPMNVSRFHNLVNYGFHHQYMFNTLQLNNGDGTFSEIAQLAGIAKSDWSWAPLFFDIDFDGLKDLFISNGVKHQFLFGDFENILQPKSQELNRNLNIREITDLSLTNVTSNVAYKYLGDFQYKKYTDLWIDQSEFNSNGAAYGDLDNDGDLDLVTNNMDANVSMYESKSANGAGGNYVKFILTGPEKNKFALGTKIKIKKDDEILYQELHNAKGYLSSVEYCLIFGLGDMNSIPVTEIIWPDGKSTTINNLEANKVYTLNYNEVTKTDIPNNPSLINQALRNLSPEKIGITYQHKENQHNDYAKQILLPYSQSRNGPFIAKSDVNNDGLEDFFVGGAVNQSGELYLQNTAGKFTLQSGPWRDDDAFEDLGVLFFDFDMDGDQDLYVVSGGSEFSAGSEMLQDRLYLNEGRGHFSKTTNSLPPIHTSGQVVKADDIDQDGDIDIFIGGRLIPDKYPYSPSSHLLINENGRFVDATKENAPELEHIGIVTDAVFVDYDQDHDNDLIVVGEWTPIQFLENKNGSFKKASIAGLENSTGLWFSLAANDIDQDGDVDLFAGNLGLNSKFKVENGNSLHVYCGDFDNSGTFDIVLSNSYQDQLVPIRGRECSSRQMPFIEKKFPSFQSFAEASITEIYGLENLENALHYEADLLESVYIENLGDGKFEIKKLPTEAQFSAILDFEFFDIDQDGQNEILSVGNIYHTEVETMRLDASYGTIIKFETNKLSTMDSKLTGFLNKGDARNICGIKIGDDKRQLLLVTNNDEPLNVFEILY